jgi:hypothetical protein
MLVFFGPDAPFTRVETRMALVAFHGSDPDRKAANQYETQQGDDQLLRQGHRYRLIPAAILKLLATATRTKRISFDFHIMFFLQECILHSKTSSP